MRKRKMTEVSVRQRSAQIIWQKTRTLKRVTQNIYNRGSGRVLRKELSNALF